MELYHYTSRAHLHGIGLYGLTVGDVPTDLSLVEGRIGVWLTSSLSARNHGLEGSAVDKTEVRISVELPEGRPLWKWDEWASRNVTKATLATLEAAREEAARTWFVYFGWIPRSSIRQVVSMKSGEEIPAWDKCSGGSESCPAWPYWQRKVWHRKMLKSVRRTLAYRQTISFSPNLVAGLR